MIRTCTQRTSGRLLVLATIATLACDHSRSYVFVAPEYGPISSGPDIRLTYNADQDYWPTWSEDQSAITYAFVDSTQASRRLYGHRCIGLMPATGGTRFWQWCDNAATQDDSVSSFPAFAVGADGRLLYLESVSGLTNNIDPIETTLWLADTAAPKHRRMLATLPLTVGDSIVSWMADLQWTGPSSFIGLAQHYLPGGHCGYGPLGFTCSFVDSVFMGEMVVRGTITPTGATLTPVAGTEGATGYSFADDGATLVFTRRNDLHLLTVPATGGTAAVGPLVTNQSGAHLLGLSCRGTTCIVAVGPVALWAQYPDTTHAGVIGNAFQLRRVSLATGASDSLLQRPYVISCPLLAANGDVIAETGTEFGHLQTYDVSGSDLHLYPGLARQ
jgi:hypothetical protein